MKNIIKATAIVASLFAASAFANDCGDLLFYGQTANHKKEVRICMYSKDSQNFINYRFGKIGQKPEMNLVKPVAAVTYFIPHSAVISAYALYIPNGDVSYSVGSGTNDENEEMGYVTVLKNSRTLADINLDLNTVVNNIGYVNGHNMSDYGIRDDMDEDSLSATTVLATPRS